MNDFDVQQFSKREMARRVMSRKHLLPFVQRFNDQYIPGWVHKDICARLEKFSQDVVDKKSPRLMMFMPPRHGKSELASRCFPAWHLGNNPSHEIIACSYSGSLAMSFSRRVRALIRENAYATLFPETRLDPDSQSAEQWLIHKHGGGYLCSGVGGGITGRGCSILCLDDPVKNREEAESETTRTAVKDWYTSTAYTRLAPGGGVLLIMTRWHDDDLAGWLLGEQETGGDKWELIQYPAVAKEDEKYRKKGQALHNARYPLQSLNRIQNAIGPRDWSALYQQDPVSDEGAYFTRTMIRYYNPEDIDRSKMTIYTAWDLAIGKLERNDYSVGLVCGIDQKDKLYILHMVRGRWDGGELVDHILDCYEQFPANITGVERGHIEMAIGPFLEKRIRERRLYEMYVENLKVGRRDKEARARAIQGRMQQGMVLFPRGLPWNDALVNELLRFPNGKHDDCVDALTWIGQMMAEFHTLRDKPEPSAPSWKDKIPGFLRAGEHKSAMSA